MTSPRTRRGRWGANLTVGCAGALALLVGSLAGCIFSTREPESSGGGSGVEWVSPQTLGSALGNMKRALDAKEVINYGRSFSGAHLEMVLDPADLGELGDAASEFESWSAQLEEQRMLGILNATLATLTVAWTVQDSLDESASIRYYKDLGYRLTFVQTPRTVVYSGKADVYFEDDGTGQWFIIKWVDKRDGSSNRTWGWLRARNAVEF